MCCVALPCCLFNLACFFLPSFSSLIKTCTSHPRQSLFLGKMSCLGWDVKKEASKVKQTTRQSKHSLALLFVWPCLLLSSFLSLKHVYTYVCTYIHSWTTRTHIHIYYMCKQIRGRYSLYTYVRTPRRVIKLITASKNKDPILVRVNSLSNHNIVACPYLVLWYVYYDSQSDHTFSWAENVQAKEEEEDETAKA